MAHGLWTAMGCHAGHRDEDTVRLSLTGVYIGQIAAAVLAVLAVGGELRDG